MRIFSFRKTAHWCTVCVTQSNWVRMWFSCFAVLRGNAEAQVIWGGIVKHLLIAYFIGNISAKKYQNPFMCVKVIASQMWDVLRHGVVVVVGSSSRTRSVRNCLITFIRLYENARQWKKRGNHRMTTFESKFVNRNNLLHDSVNIVTIIYLFIVKLIHCSFFFATDCIYSDEL